MKKKWTPLLLVLATTVLSAPLPPEELLWPANPPGYSATKEPERTEERSPDSTRRDRFLYNVSIPGIRIFRPSQAKATDMAVIVCPGGGFVGLAFDQEGTKVCAWLNSLGITAILLKYRTQVTSPDSPGVPVPLVDVQRAIRVTRARAQEQRISPRKVGVMGFSAGGALTLWAGTRFVVKPSAGDSVDRLSSRPDFLIAIYPPVDEDLEQHLSPSPPPLFAVYAMNDPLAGGAVPLVAAARAAEVAMELHIFPTGGHGFGLGSRDEPVGQWPGLCERWLMKTLPPILSSTYQVDYAKVPQEKGLHKRINCGSSADYQESSGHVWSADPLYRVGGNPVYRGQIPIVSTADPEIYRSERWGVEGYRIKVPAGSYEVRLHFAETFEQVTGPGQRLFNVSIQNTPVLKNFDVFAEAGNKRQCAVVKSFPVVARKDGITIGFKEVKQSTLINGIEVIAK